MTSLDLDFGRPAAGRPGSLIVGSGWWRPRPGGRKHEGIDINMPAGTEILAVADGVVIKSQKTPSGDAGIWVGLKHNSGWVSRYMHLTKALVEVGQPVRKGQVIGLSGDTGLSSTPHLHFDLRLDPTMIPVLGLYLPPPTTGYGGQSSYGVAVPAEPWIPVDGYWQSTMDEAKKHGILLYQQRKLRDALIESKRRSSALPFVLLVGGTISLLGLAIFAGARRQRKLDLLITPLAPAQSA
jgi:murein DD-endopeptidase MepM/ murein hydrolase activator NlpD